MYIFIVQLAMECKLQTGDQWVMKLSLKTKQNKSIMPVSIKKKKQNETWKFFIK